ncbi:MAG: hypothetical protein IPO85_14250 [Saprospiraceae bacterium]|uniref:Uncharacterized protein n=1 Tax=Candidatus Defluviibacterium haderslevense TaxID=2981993 RepID=A0A9D7XE45_9BACT|nr:hypothetical protein [Candidatus Defluviibacterium haderslevense]
MKKRNYLRYSTGIISLTLLPLFCIVYIFSNNIFEPIKGIEFGKITTKELERFFPRGVNKFRNYREFILKGNEKEDFNSLEMARPFINKLWISKDTMNGIHIMLNEDIKFWAFIKILDIMKDEKVEYYIWEKIIFGFFIRNHCVLRYIMALVIVLLVNLTFQLKK